MAESLKQLIDLFSLSRINFDSANRKTLDNWIKKIQLQKRRELLFETSCERGKKKSKVALCKKSKTGRPGFSIELSTLSTKKLRGIIKQFINELGLNNYGSLQKKSPKDLEKISREKGWEQVLFMSDVNLGEVEDDKEGGMLTGVPMSAPRHRGARPRPHIPLVAGATPRKHHADVIFQPSRHKIGHMAKPKPKVKKKRSVYKKPPARAPLDTEQFETIPKIEDPEIRVAVPWDIESVEIPPPSRHRRSRSRSKGRRSRGTSEAAEILPSEPPPMAPEPQRSPEPDAGEPDAILPQVATPQRGGRRGSRHRARRSHSHSPRMRHSAANSPRHSVGSDVAEEAAVDVAVLPSLPEAEPIPPLARESVFPKKDAEEQLAIANIKKLKDEIPKFPKLPPQPLPSNLQRQCYREKEFQDECENCTPTDLSRIRLPRDAKKELSYLAVQRKLVCERTALLKCKFDELRYQRMCWDLFHENSFGDFFARITKDKFKVFDKCDPSTVFDTNEISKLRGILACYSNSQKVCKGYHQVKAKEHNQTSRIGPNYTLPTMRYDQLEQEKKVDVQNRFIETALRNRQPEPETGYKKVCEKEEVPPPPPIDIEKKIEEKFNSLSGPGVMVQKPVPSTGLVPTQPPSQLVPPVAEAHPTGQVNIPLPGPAPPAQAGSEAGRFFGGGTSGFAAPPPRQIVPEGKPPTAAFQSQSEFPISETVARSLQNQWSGAADKLAEIEAKRQQFPERRDMSSEILFSFGSMQSDSRIKGVIDDFRAKGTSDEHLVELLKGLSEGGATRNAAITVEKLKQIYPPVTQQVAAGPSITQDPGHFHFGQQPAAMRSQKYANSPKGVVNFPAIPSAEHSHVNPAETPAQSLMRQSQVQPHAELPAVAAPVIGSGSIPRETKPSSLFSMSLADELAASGGGDWDSTISQYEREYPSFDVGDIGKTSEKHVAFGFPESPEKTAGGLKTTSSSTPKKEPKRKSLVGELFKRKKSNSPKKPRKRSKTPKKKKAPKKPKSPKVSHRLPKEGSGWDDDDYLAGMVSEQKVERKPATRLIRQPNIRRKRHFI